MLSDLSNSLVSVAKRFAHTSLTTLFEQNPDRAKQFSYALGPLTIDLSKQFITQDSLQDLINIAHEQQLEPGIDALFAGAQVNPSEHQQAMHWLLRVPDSNVTQLNNAFNKTFHEVQACLDKMRIFCEQIHNKQWLGETGQPICNIVNLGVGGSDLGPKLATQALIAYANPNLTVRFTSNIDSHDLSRTLASLNPHQTLFIVTSKSFKTLETLANARSAKHWLHQAGITDTRQHFVAVTSAPQTARDFGIQLHCQFPMWDWVGGRYSIWSAVGLSLMLSVGPEHFSDFLAGAHEVDLHFKTTPLERNVPFLMGALGVLYVNGFGYETQGIIPYDERLTWLPVYLQQLDMESNGKSVDKNNQPIHYRTGPIVWGGVGTNSQHSFHQLLHQGTLSCPIDFLVPLRDHCDMPSHHQALFANCLAQSQALMQGSDNHANEPYRTVPGNKPSTLIGYQDLKPRTLGALLALYEHKTYVQSLFWNINAFDQWGVELGKRLSKPINEALTTAQAQTNLDPSTAAWIRRYKDEVRS